MTNPTDSQVQLKKVAVHFPRKLNEFPRISGGRIDATDEGFQTNEPHAPDLRLKANPCCKRQSQPQPEGGKCPATHAERHVHWESVNHCTLG